MDTTSQPPPIPKPQGSSQTTSKQSGFPVKSILLIGALGIGILLLVIGVNLISELRREDTQADYIKLAGVLMSSTQVKGSAKPELSDQELEEKLREVKALTDDISKRGKELAEISQGYQKMIQGLESVVQNFPDRGKFIGGLAQLGLGYYLRDKDAMSKGGGNLIEQGSALYNTYLKVRELAVNRQALTLHLSKIGAKWQGGVTNQNLVDFGFHENSSKETLTLKNVSGRDLHEVVVEVRLSDEEGKSYLRYHFIPEWKLNEERVCKYSDEGFDVPLVTDVKRVAVRVMSREVCEVGSYMEKGLLLWGDKKPLTP